MAISLAQDKPKGYDHDELAVAAYVKPEPKHYPFFIIESPPAGSAKDSFLLIQAKVMRKQWVTCMKVWDVRYSRSAKIKAIEEE